MSIESPKLVVVLKPDPGAEPLLGSEFFQSKSCLVCKACPLRAGGLAFKAYGLVSRDIKAVRGSVEAGSKEMHGEEIGLDGQTVPTCFHPTRSTTQVQDPTAPVTINKVVLGGLLDKIGERTEPIAITKQ